MDKYSNLDEKYHEAGRLLDENRLAEASTIIEYIEARQKIAQHDSKKKQLHITSIIVLISILLVSLGIKFTIPVTEVNITLTTNGMQITHESGLHDYKLNGSLTGKQSLIDNTVYFNTISLSTYNNFPEFSKEPFSGDISVYADNTTLTDLVINTPGLSPVLMIDNRNNNISLYIKNASISGKIIIHNLSDISTYKNNNNKNNIMKNIAGGKSPTYFFKTAGSIEQPVPDTITISQNYSMDLIAEKVQSIIFSREEPLGSGNFQSTIINGNIHLPELDKIISLTKDEFFTLVCKKCNHTAIKYDDNHILLQIKGKVSSLYGGHSENIKNFMPTILEYLYHNQKLAMIWASVIFCWGFIWNLRRWIN